MIEQIKILLYNLSLYWDIEKQYYHRNDRLKKQGKSIYRQKRKSDYYE